MSDILPYPDLLLQHAIEAFRAEHGLQARFATMSANAQRHYEWHDMVHVLFGLGTSMREEAQADGWTYFGTDIASTQWTEFDELPEEMALVKELGTWAITRGYLLAIPDYLTIAWRARRLERKWPWSDNDAYRSCPVGELRREFGIDRALAR